jgi:hypothetical protein
MTLPKRVKTAFRREKMKKIIASAVGLMLVGGVAATSVVAAESQFGGFWRTRFTFDDNLRGATGAVDADTSATNDTGSNYKTDTRSRLYYTAKFSDNFKFVNKFEFDANWGDDGETYGDIGSDGKTFEVKNSYIDYTMGMLNTKLGVQTGTIARGFLFADDFSGAIVTADFGTVKLPVLYATSVDEEVRDEGPDAPGDGHLLSIMPSIMVSDALTLTPHVTYSTVTEDNADFDESDVYWIGADIDLKLDAVTAWGTFIYNGGEADDDDVSAYLLAAGADAGIVHGQAFYASGDDDAADGDRDDFQNPLGSSYYWSEIMGLGVFDDGASNGSPADSITNVWAANVGVTLKPMDKLTAQFDAWYAELVEDDAAGEDELGLEFDAKVTYALEDNLNLDFIFAYLVAGDATGDEDVMEGGVQVSLAF